MKCGRDVSIREGHRAQPQLHLGPLIRCPVSPESDLALGWPSYFASALARDHGSGVPRRGGGGGGVCSISVCMYTGPLGLSGDTQGSLAQRWHLSALDFLSWTLWAGVVSCALCPASRGLFFPPGLGND